MARAMCPTGQRCGARGHSPNGSGAVQRNMVSWCYTTRASPTPSTKSPPPPLGSFPPLQVVHPAACREGPLARNKCRYTARATERATSAPTGPPLHTSTPVSPSAPAASVPGHSACAARGACRGVYQRHRGDMLCPPLTMPTVTMTPTQQPTAPIAGASGMPRACTSERTTLRLAAGGWKLSSSCWTALLMMQVGSWVHDRSCTTGFRACHLGGWSTA
jgi:hypothetical protein